MGHRTARIAALLLLLCPAAFASDTPQDKAPAVPLKDDAALREPIDRSIARGVAWLMKNLPDDGDASEPGYTALALLALRSCGVPADDKAVVRGFETLRRAYPVGKDTPDGNNTYAIACTLLALEAHYPPDAAGLRAIPDSDREWIVRLVQGLLKGQDRNGGFGYGWSDQIPVPGRRAAYWDNSNSQYGALGLGAAGLLGYPPRTDAWIRIFFHWQRTQEADGPELPRYEDPSPGEPGYAAGTPRVAGKNKARGWGYSEEVQGRTGALTTGGVSSIALCRQALEVADRLDPGTDRDTRRALRDGIAWLQMHFSVRGNPQGPSTGRGDAEFHHYYLYGLERAGVLAGSKWIGTHDWFIEGARFLMEEQFKEGFWVDGKDIAAANWKGFQRSPQADTCFALLFLKRATERLRVRGTATPRTTEGVDLSPGPTLGDAEFRDLFERVFRDYASADAAGRRFRAADFVQLGTRSIPRLVMHLDDAGTWSRAAALSALEWTTRDDHGFDPEASPEKRAAAIRDWEDCWAEKRKTIVAEVQIGRFTGF